MANLNKVLLIGRLTQHPDKFNTPSGSLIVTLHLAVNRPGKDADGKKTSETTYLDVTILGKLAEHAAYYLYKGREVFVEGRLRMQQWQDKQTGKTRQKIDILAESFQAIGKLEGEPTQQQGNLPIDSGTHSHSTYSGYAHDNQDTEYTF